MCPNVARKIAQATFTIAIWGNIPRYALAQTNGRPSINCQDNPTGSYTLGLHIGAIFAVFVGSTLGITLPIFTKGHRGRVWTEAFFLAKYFGTGVIIATAFVHLLYEAFTQLESPCIHLSYKPTAPAIAMAAALMVMLVDFQVQRIIRRSQPANAPLVIVGCCTEPSPDLKKNDDGESEMKPPSPELQTPEYRLVQRQKYLDLLVVEGGIVFHSVMVGLGLGVYGDHGFVSYMVAIIFHQFCDGLALGTLHAEIDFVGQRIKQFILIGAYAFITPIGIAIGVGVRSTFRNNDPTTILVIGVLDSISAGVLTYGALVDLVAKNLIFHQGLLNASDARAASAVAALAVGAAVMSVIGGWA